jgi:DNA polymerase elongation subunit (family B)
MTFRDEWISQMCDQLATVNCSPLSAKQKAKVEKAFDEQCNDFPARIHNNVTDVYTETTGVELIDFFLTGEGILTGNGMFFKQHEDSINLPAKILEFLGTERKRAKNEMFEHVNDTDRTIYNALDTKQKVIKVLANSWFGVLGQAAFIFHNKYCGPAITYSGYNIITHALMAIEGFLSNNIRFKTTDQILRFISLSLKETPRTPITQFMTNEKIYTMTVDRIVEYLQGLCDYDMDAAGEAIIRKSLSGIFIEDLWTIYFKRNIYEFLSQADITSVLGDCLDGEFINPDKPPEAVKDSVDGLYELLMDYVAYDDLCEDRFERAHEISRKSILLMDTDSAFINLNTFYNFVADQFDVGDRNDKNYYVPVCNIMTHFLSRYIHRTLHKFAANMNIPKEKHKLIAMKSEFLYSRIILTDNKKQYAGSIVLNEGHILEKPKLDLKGLSIKKVGLNKDTRDYFTAVLKDQIINSETLNVPEILQMYWDYERIIFTGLTEHGSTKFTTPGKFSSHDSYKKPDQMPVVRGVTVWNHMHPEKPIGSHEKVNLVKLKGATVEEIRVAMDNDQENLERILALIAKSDAMKKYGITILAIPKAEAKLPDWCLPLINVETIMSDIMGNTIVLLESLGIRLLEVKGKDYYSNIIRM